MKPRSTRHVVSDDSVPLLVYQRPEWHSRAACRGKSDLFFPTGSGSGRAAQGLARRYCSTCPVYAECEDAAVGESFGVWAGRLQLTGWRENRRAS